MKLIEIEKIKYKKMGELVGSRCLGLASSDSRKRNENRDLEVARPEN